MKASRVMTRDVHCVAPDFNLEHAWALMQQLSVRHLPVLAEGTLVGIVSDRDLLVRGSRRDDGALMFPLGSVVREAMTPSPVAVPASTPVSKLAALMLQYRIDSVPIVDLEGHLEGLVTTTDLLELLTEPEQISDVLPFSYALRTPNETLSS